MAQRLEQSIGAAMPTSAIEALNQRLDEIGSQLAQTLEKVPTREALDHVERQISDMGQQLGRAEEQLGKVGGVEAHLLSLIERLDERTSAPASIEPAQMEDIANKAANEAARLVADETKQNAERLDAMHRDIKTMSDKSRELGDRLVSTLEAVHESLKQLVQQVERGAAFQTRPRAPFMERARQAEARPAAPQAPQFKMPMPQQRPPEPTMAQAATAAAKTGEASQNAAKERLRDRLGAAIPDFQEGETPPPFGRAKRSAPGEKAVDLDAAPRGPEGLDAAPDDLVAAARRAAQAAAARAEERGGRRRSSSPLPGSAPGGEQQGRRKRSLLIISAAVLLALSAILLYGRLSSKPETDATPASTEQTAPAPSGDTEGTTAPQGGETAPADTLEKSGAWQPLPDTGASPSDSADDDSAPSTGVTDMAKSSAKSAPAPSSGNVPAMPASELSPEPQLASLHPTGQAALPPGVIFSVEEPGDAPDATAAAAQGAAPLAMPANLPLPPAALGPLPLRKAAAKGDPKAQYEIGVRYADGVGTKADLKTAAEWFERAASAGLAPAQYRLAAMYERGLGVGEDLGQARTWYAAAAEKGNIKAMHNLAVSVSGRDGSTPDYKLAAKWYAEAAAYGLPDSQFNLAILAEHGLGMKKDPAEAYKWFSLAAAHGDADAAKRREVIRVQLAPAALAQAEATVKAWKAKPAIAGANEVAENSAWAAKAPATEAVSLVSRAQTLLNKLGYDVGPPDGLVGPRTQTAIKMFQQRNGLSGDRRGFHPARHPARAPEQLSAPWRRDAGRGRFATFAGPSASKIHDICVSRGPKH